MSRLMLNLLGKCVTLAELCVRHAERPINEIVQCLCSCLCFAREISYDKCYRMSIRRCAGRSLKLQGMVPKFENCPYYARVMTLLSVHRKAITGVSEF